MIWRWCSGQEASTFPVVNPITDAVDLSPLSHRGIAGLEPEYMCVCVLSGTKMTYTTFTCTCQSVLRPHPEALHPSQCRLKSHDIPTMNIPPFSGHWDATDEDSSRRRRREHLGRKEEVMRRARRLKDRAEGKRREGEVIRDPGVLLWSTWNWRAWNTCSLWQMLSRALSLCVSRLLQVTAGNALSNRRETRLNSWFTYISITLKLGWFQSCQGTV